MLDDANTELINAVPWYKTVTNFPISDLEASLIDVVVVSTPSGMLGLPFLARTKNFSAKVSPFDRISIFFNIFFLYAITLMSSINVKYFKLSTYDFKVFS